MKTTKQLIESLEKVTGKKVKLKENTENISPIAQYVLDYEEEMNDEESWERLKPQISKLKTIDDVENYYTNVRGWADDDDLSPMLDDLLEELEAEFPERGY